MSYSVGQAFQPNIRLEGLTFMWASRSCCAVKCSDAVATADPVTPTRTSKTERSASTV